MRTVLPVIALAFAFGTASIWAGIASTRNVDALHLLGGWYGEVETASGIKMAPARSDDISDGTVSIVSVKLLSLETIEILYGGASALSVQVESSFDLRVWTRVETAEVQTGRVILVGVFGLQNRYSHRFFRLRIMP